MMARVFLALVAVLVPPAAFAGEIDLAWEPVAGATDYAVFIGRHSQIYRRAENVGASTQVTVEVPADCVQYHVAVKAFNGAGESPQFSNEVSGWPQPEVQFDETQVVEQGGQFVMNITGANFMPGAELIFEQTGMEGDPLVTVESLEVINCHEIEALVSVEPLAPGFRAMEIGNHSFHVRNPDNVFGSGDFEVRLNPERLDINRSSGTRDRVDGNDLVWLAFAHGAAEGDHRFNPDADLNGDGYVDGEDLVYLAMEFGSCWSGDYWSPDACD